MQSLPGIKEIRYIETRLLPEDTIFHGLNGGTVNIISPSYRIPFCGTAVCQHYNTREDGSNREETKLTFTTLHRLPKGYGLSFIVTDTNGDSYVIGAPGTPDTKINITGTTGETAGEPSALRYEITYTSVKSKVKCNFF